MATLKSLVDETSNIKNELKTCHTTLKNNLIEKGVDVSNGDKLATLVDKVNSVKTIKLSPSDNVIFDYNTKTSISTTSSTKKLIYTTYIFGSGAIRMLAKMYRQSSGNTTAVITFDVVRGGNIIESKTLSSSVTSSSNAQLLSTELNVKTGDTLNIYLTSSKGTYYAYLTLCTMCGDIE